MLPHLNDLTKSDLITFLPWQAPRTWRHRDNGQSEQLCGSVINLCYHHLSFITWQNLFFISCIFAYVDILINRHSPAICPTTNYVLFISSFPLTRGPPGHELTPGVAPTKSISKCWIMLVISSRRGLLCLLAPPDAQQYTCLLGDRIGAVRRRACPPTPDTGRGNSRRGKKELHQGCTLMTSWENSISIRLGGCFLCVGFFVKVFSVLFVIGVHLKKMRWKVEK